MNSGEDVKVPISAMQVAEDVDPYQQDLTALGILSGDPFQMEATYGGDAPQLVPMNLNEDITNEDILCSMPDLQSSGNADMMPADELMPANETGSGFGHKCTVCGKRFLSTVWLDKHMAMHVKSEQYSCDKCGAVFSRKNSLYYHQLKEHSNKGPRSVNCNICGKTVGVGGPLTNHLRSHTQSAAHSAAQQYKKKLLKSQITHRKPQEILKRNVRSLLKCNFCGKTFHRVSSLSNHLRVHTNDKTPNKRHSSTRPLTEETEVSITEKLLKYQCHICNRRLVNNIALSNHLRSHGLTLAMKFKKMKRDMTLMAFHRRKNQKSKTNVGVENQKSKNLDTATKVQNSELDNLTKTYDFNPSKIYKCKYCGLQFNNKFGMAGHVKIHKAEFGPQTVLSASKPMLPNPDNLEARSNQNDVIHANVDECSSQNNAAETNSSKYLKEQYDSNKTVTDFSSQPYVTQERVVKFSAQRCEPDERVAEYSDENCVPNISVANFQSETAAPDANVDDFVNLSSNERGANVDEFTNPSILSVKCKLCGVEFDNGVSLALHSRKHKRGKNNQDTYKCMECFTILASRSGHMRHILMHTGTRMHNCPECGIRFLQKIHLQRHMTAHQNKLPFKCDVCTATYIEERGLVKHKRMHNDPNWGFVTCAHCKFVFASDVILKTHIRARHTGKQSFECNVCRAQFMKNTHLNQHMRLHDIQLRHSGDAMQHKSTSSQVHKGKTRKRGKSQKKLICEICQHPFGYKCSLKVHMRNIHHHFQCGICLTYVDDRYLSKASGMLHKSVCISCFPGKGKKPKANKDSNIGSISLQPETSSVSQLVHVLLSELVDEELLRSKGVLEKSVDEQLQAMVEVCGDTAVTSKQHTHEECIRENMKRLFSLCVGKEATSSLLQSESLEAVLCGMLTSLSEA